MDLVAIKHQRGHGRDRVGVDRDAVGVAVGIRRGDVVDQVVAQGDVLGGAADVDRDRRAGGGRGGQVAELKPLDGDPVATIDEEEADVGVRHRHVGAVEDRHLAREGAKDDGACHGVSRDGHRHQLLVDPGSHLDHAAGGDHIRGVLDRLPRLGKSPRVGVIPVGRHDEGRTGDRSGEAQRQSTRADGLARPTFHAGIVRTVPIASVTAYRRKSERRLRLPTR